MWAYKFQPISPSPHQYSHTAVFYIPNNSCLISCPSHTMTTAMSKAMAACLCVMMMLCGLLVEDANATAISKPAMKKNAAHGCSPLHPQNCAHTPANKYTRGCETEKDCRDGSHPKNH